MKIKLQSKEVRIQICLKPNLNFQNHVQVDYLERGEQDEDFGVGFTGFG